MRLRHLVRDRSTSQKKYALVSHRSRDRRRNPGRASTDYRDIISFSHQTFLLLISYHNDPASSTSRASDPAWQAACKAKILWTCATVSLIVCNLIARNLYAITISVPSVIVKHFFSFPLIPESGSHRRILCQNNHLIMNSKLQGYLFAFVHFCRIDDRILVLLLISEQYLPFISDCV